MTDIVLGCERIDRFLDCGTSAWKRGVDMQSNVANSFVIRGVHRHSDIESGRAHFTNTEINMASNESGRPTGEKSNGLRPLKSRPEDRIASIMDNPFYKSFGVRHPRSPRDVPSASASAKIPFDSDGKYVREDLGDYRPGSGFVHKLMGRFASLGIREEPPVHIKNASSVEDILDRTSQTSEVDVRHRDRGRVLSSSLQHRARSVESLNRRRAPQSIPVSLRHVESSTREHTTSSSKSPREVHIVAPDVKLARDDIILIENPPVEPQLLANNEIENDTTVHFSSFKDDLSPNELPKPNTVSTVRSFFESGKPLSPTSAHSEEPFSADSEPIFTPRDSMLTPRDSSQIHRESSSTPRDPSLTPRDSGLTPRDSNLTPRESILTPRESNSASQGTTLAARDSRINPMDTVFTPREPFVSPRDSKVTPRDSKPSIPQSPRYGTDISQRHDASKSRFSWTSDLKTTGSSASADSSNSTVPPPLPSSPPPSSATAVSAAAADASKSAKPSVFHGSGSAENRPPASPRSTAAVKAIPASRPTVPSRPSRPSTAVVANSGATVPPSFTPNIKKTSPVMPVAPFKESKTEEGDSNRYLIYAKKNASSNPQKSQRVKDYGEVSTDLTSGSMKNATEDGEIKKANKVNRTHTKGRAPPIPKPRQSDDNVLLSPRSADSSENQWSEVFKPTSPRIEDSRPEAITLTPVEPKRPSRTPQAFFTKSDEEVGVSQSVSVSRSENSKMETEAPAKEEIQTEPADSNKPVKGIPSIIANRMKQQNTQIREAEPAESRPPGELFGVRLGKTRHEDNSAEEANEIPRKRLAPAPKTVRTEKEENSNLPSEIEDHIASVRNRMGLVSRNKSPGVSQIFDSSQLQKKRREKQAAKSSAQAGVPRLDLSSITSEDSSSAGSEGGYRVTPREIKPCNIEFIGANVSTGRSLLKKNRRVKINIRFHDVLVETFEYPSEESMLEEYMREHPNEVLVLEEESWPTESSDDIPDTPRGGGSGLESELLKSNTSLAHTGTLQSYRGKFQQEYELGSVLTAPEKEPEPSMELELVDPDSMQLVPADEDYNQTWSSETNSDLLF